MSHVDLFFSGLIAFVSNQCPYADASMQPPGQEYVIFLEDADGDEHKAELGVFARYAPESVTIGGKEYKRSMPTRGRKIGKEDYLIWSLEDRVIGFQGVTASVRLGAGMRTPGDKNWKYERPQNGDDASHFSWIPELHRACPGKKADLKLSKLLKSPPFWVRAATMLDTNWSAASMLTASFDSDPNDPVTQSVYDFGADYHQVLADEVKLTFNLERQNDAIVILLTKFGDDNDVLTIPIRVLKKTKDDPEPDAVVDLTNLPPDTSAGMGVSHFPHFYDRLFGWYNGGKCPLPKKEEMIEGVQPVKCTVCSVCGPGLGP
jgi:hypothetical protein